jgi:hypothetical protein
VELATVYGRLWRTLCVEKPFHLQLAAVAAAAALSASCCSVSAPVSSNDDEIEQDDDSDDDEEDDVVKYRIMYTSFVRCLRYLQCIKDEAVLRHTRNDATSPSPCFPPPAPRARTTTAAATAIPPIIPAAAAHRQQAAATAAPHEEQQPHQQPDENRKKRHRSSDNSCDQESKTTNNNKKPRYAYSSLTDRLLLSPRDGKKKKKITKPSPTSTTTSTTSSIQLRPWSGAVYSIVNWMVSYQNVEGIQIACLETLHVLLERDEQQRTTALCRAGLGEVILRSMQHFSTSVAFHTAALNALVVVARPAGGREGMLLSSSSSGRSTMMATSSYASGIFGNDGGADNREQQQQHQQQHGVGVLLDSMRRFHNHEMLQATACWSLVNLALIPAQRRLLVQRGAIRAVIRAMSSSGVHSSSAPVRHRALFALVNLVISRSSSTPTSTTRSADSDEEEEEEEEEERTLVDASVEQIVQLAVLAMRKFCSNPDILKNACLLLRNTSLISHHRHCDILLFTPHCYEMLEYYAAATNFFFFASTTTTTTTTTDRLLQVSASGTLHHLQMYLHKQGNKRIRALFEAFRQDQHWNALELAFREATRLREHEHTLLLSSQERE